MLARNRTERYMFRSASQAPLAMPAEPAPAAAVQLRGATQAQQTGTVLVSFQFEQNGDQVRVIDADGSVYTGLLFAEGIGRAEAKESVETTGVQLRERLLEDAKAAKQSSQTDQLQSQSLRAPWVFRVNGTNKTLREPVQLDGVLVPDTGVAAAAGPSTGAGPAPLSRRLASDRSQTATGAAQRPPGSAPPPAAPSPTGAAATTSPAFPRQQLQSQTQGAAAAAPVSSGFTNLSSIQRIQGTLRIGATNQFQVDAYRSAK
jgi:hypothetical protein